MQAVLSRAFCLKRFKELEYADKLKDGLKATFVRVKDTTVGGGCGPMFNILVESPEFNGKSLVQQHTMVTDILRADLPMIHGFSLKTRPSQQ
jgi:stress-induced morphogen